MWSYRGAALFALAMAGCATVHGDGVIEVDDCSARGIAEAIDDALEGATIYVGSCDFSAVSVQLPPGVGLAGDGPGTATIRVAEGRVGVDVLGAGDGCTTIRGVRIVSDGLAAIRVSGEGDVCIEDVEIIATRGVGIEADGVTRLLVRRSRIEGPVTESNADDEPLEPTADSTFVAGITARCAADLTLEDIEVSGFSLFGVAVSDGRMAATRLLTHTGLGAGVIVRRSDAVLEDVETRGTIQGMRLIPAYGLVAVESRLSSSGLVIEESQNYGALLIGGVAMLEGGRIGANANAGLWVQQGEASVRGTVFDGNGSAAIAGRDSSGLVIEDVVLAHTRRMTRIVGTMPVEVGVGLAIGGLGPFVLRRARIEDNDILAGIITFDTPPTEAFMLEDVTVSPVDRPLVVEGGPPPDGWDADVAPAGASMTVPSGTYGFWGAASGAPAIPVYEPVCP